jgi:centromere protein I
VPIEAFNAAYTTFFQPAERALSSQGIDAYSKLINFYASLVQRQASILIARSRRPITSESQVIYDLAAHVSTLSTSLLLSLPARTGGLLISSIFSFYEILSACSKPHTVPIILPPMHLVYLLAQETSSTTLSRVCGIIGNYKQAFDQHPKPVKDYYPASVTDGLNYCLRDIYNLIWVSRGLITADQKAVGLYCDPALRSTLHQYLSGIDREYAIGIAFGISNNAWLASLSAAAWRAMEEREIGREGFDRNSIRYHQGPVTQRSLEVLKRKGGVSVDWDGPQGYKVFVLNWLAERGLDGVRQLMFATVTDLRGKV